MAADRRTGVRFTESHKQLIKLLAAVAVDQWRAEQEEEKKSKEEESTALPERSLP